ncbi:cyclin-A2-3-like [Pyrus ussuriensis x Pyrus communis]|uniref:Cyclin-A2-3-like n=1 Tax=Pyrus ussuriensis x Pyrus communis TaxID=2448454 RepID=A0A5N5I7D8_9ROSA|nr:cyclin-A2-3-like [Pyrus ussuriensis x Pyrus communis]
MPSPANPMQNHQLHPKTQAANIEKKVMEIVEMVWIAIMRPPPFSPPTKKNLKLYEPTIGE